MQQFLVLFAGYSLPMRLIAPQPCEPVLSTGYRERIETSVPVPGLWVLRKAYRR
jgi:hypothetical protein